ncbi:MAG: hypothetical protein NE328_05450 [Lentisphaeraceae bacterium]|nr:hypothetical protein [Lentisphaeraceae bacterium]
MNIILNDHLESLTSILGGYIDYALIPKLNISSCQSYPAESMYGKSYGHFYESSLINLRIRTLGADRIWLELRPGPDEPIEPWAAFSASILKSPNYGNVTKDLSWFKKLNQGTSFEKSIIEQENEFLDSHVDGFGMSRLNCWYKESKITKIELHEFNPYVACIFSHSDGIEWAIYAEYDFNFWISFSKDIVSQIRQTSESVIEVF